MNYVLLLLLCVISLSSVNAVQSSAKQSLHSRIDGTLSEALEGLKPHKKINPNPPPPVEAEKPKRQNRPTPPTKKDKKRK